MGETVQCFWTNTVKIDIQNKNKHVKLYAIYIYIIINNRRFIGHFSIFGGKNDYFRNAETTFSASDCFGVFFLKLED